MASLWWEIRCDGCGGLVAHTPSTQPLPGIYCSDCMEARREDEEAEDDRG